MAGVAFGTRSIDFEAAATMGTIWSSSPWAISVGTSMASRSSVVSVSVSIDSRPAQQAQRTQRLEGESKRVGAEFSDPAAAQEQLVHGGSVAESSMHIWRSALPADLAAGEHTATVTSTDRDGTVSTETIEFTVTD